MSWKGLRPTTQVIIDSRFSNSLMQTESIRTSDFLTRLPSLIRISFKALLSPEAIGYFVSSCLQSQIYNLLFLSTQVGLGGGRKGKKSPFIFSSHIVFQALNAFDALQYGHPSICNKKQYSGWEITALVLHYDLCTKMMKPVIACHNLCSAKGNGRQNVF